MHFYRLEERLSLSSLRVSQLERQVKDLEERREDRSIKAVDANDGFVVDICSDEPTLDEVSHELSIVKQELTKLQTILQQKEKELTEVKVKSASVAVAANLENTKLVNPGYFS